MEEATDIHSAIHAGIRELKLCGINFNPKLNSLTMELMNSKHHGGALILPSNNSKGFEIVSYLATESDIKDNGVTVDDLWQCTKEHYGLTAVTGLFATASIPIDKVKLGYMVPPGVSKYTSLSSHIGVKFFPRTNLRSGSVSANTAKRIFGTTRVFGLIGRALPFAAIGLAAFDAISIGQCVYKRNN